METQQSNYKRTLAGSVGAGAGALFNGSGRTYYILEHKTETAYHHVGESQKIIIDQIELGRDGACQVRFDESCATVSRRHAAIVKEGDRCKLIPLSQTNGTYVNGNLVQSEFYLNSGDEIKLSSNGPVIGFIQPQGAKSLVNSIGLTERMNLFRQQALRPYKMAITILGIVLVLAVGGLLAYNIIQDQKHAEETAMLTAQIVQTKDELAQAKVTQEKADQAVAEAQRELINLKNDQHATAEQLKAANARAMAAEQNAKDARSAVAVANKRLSEAEEQFNKIASASEAATSTEASTTIKDVKETETTAETQEFADISDCYDAVYYVRMNNVIVYDENDQQVVNFNTEKLIGGTGFMLEDGRFVTARRVIEPWFYYQNTKLGEDKNGDNWYFEDVQMCLSLGYSVVANYTAYSKSGANFHFRSSDMKAYPLKSITESMVVTITTFVSDIKFIRKKRIPVRIYDAVSRHDWATMGKKDQLSIVDGLKFADAASLSPKSGTEVKILGYPLGQGFSDSQSVKPSTLDNNINVSSLNDEGVIELASRRWKVGNDGAPVLQLIDGEWTVIGILSHTDSSDRDNVTPIQYTKR